MNKRKLYHTWVQLRRVSFWYFLVAFVLSGIVAIFALRQNNLNALSLRNEVLKVDKANGSVEAALKELREYIHGHMNTDLASATSVYPPIQLKYRYERLVAAEKARVDQLNSKSNLYNDAQKHCEATQPQSFFGAGRLPCIQTYLDSHGGQALEQEKPIPDSLYKFNFASPAWSPDLAGWSLVVAAIMFLLFAVRFGLERWLRYQLKHHM